MVTLGAGGGHDGGIGDGGAVVTHHSAGTAGGDTDDEQLAGSGENSGNNGDQDAEGTPGGAGGEGQNTGHHEDHGGEHGVQRSGGAFHEVMDIDAGAQRGDGSLQRDGQGQDQDGGDHGVEALGDAGHGVLEGDDPAGHQIDDGEEQSDDAAPGQTHESVGIAEGADEVSGAVGAAPGVHAEEAAHVDHAGGAHGDQHQNREQQVDDLALGVHGFILCAFQSGEVTGLLGLALIGPHGTVIKLHEGQGDDKDEGQQGVEVVGNGLDKELDAADAGVQTLGGGGNGGGPGGDRGDHAHGGGGGVNEVGQLGTGDPMAVGDGSHDGAHGEAVEIVIDEDQNAQQEGSKGSPHLGLNVF